jgi:hypothetical protein
MTPRRIRFTLDGRVEVDHDGRVVFGRTLGPALVWTVPIEVPFVLVAEHRAGVALVVDQDAVGALGQDATHEPLGVCVRRVCVVAS